MRKCRRRSIFLELFSGAGGVSRALRLLLHDSFKVIEVDIENNASLDLSKKSLQQFILYLIRRDFVVGVWMGTPCTSWSRARRHDGKGPPPLRSDSQIWGLANLSTQDQARVQLGNNLARFSAQVFRVCLQCTVPVGLENPHTSRLWLIPSFQQLIHNNSAVKHVITDYCQDGMPWRKRTRILFSHVDLSSVGLVCHGKHGKCSRTQQPHVQLSGREKGQGRFRTLIAQPYPGKLCRRVSIAFQHAILDACARPYMKILGL